MNHQKDFKWRLNQWTEICTVAVIAAVFVLVAITLSHFPSLKLLFTKRVLKRTLHEQELLKQRLACVLWAESTCVRNAPISDHARNESRMQWHIFACQRLALGQVWVHARLHNKRYTKEGVRSVIWSVILMLEITMHDTSSGYTNCSQCLPLHETCTVIINW